MHDLLVFCTPNGAGEGFASAFIEVVIYVGFPIFGFIFADHVIFKEEITNFINKLPQKRRMTIRLLTIAYSIIFSVLALISNIGYGVDHPKDDVDVAYSREGEDYDITNNTKKPVDFFDVVINDKKPDNLAQVGEHSADLRFDTSVTYIRVLPKYTMSTNALGVGQPYHMPPATINDIVTKLSSDTDNGIGKDDTRVIRIINHGKYADMNLPLHDKASRKCEIWSVMNNSDGDVNITALDNAVCDDLYHSVPAHHFLTQ